MKKIITLDGVSVANEALPRVSATDQERVLAGLPGLFFWLQGGHRFQADGATLVERANGRKLVGRSPYSQYFWTQGLFANGADALVTPPDYSSNYSVPSEARFALDRWTVAIVFESLPDAGVGFLMNYPEASAPTPEMRLRIGLDTNGYFTVYRALGTSGYRIRATGGEWSGQPALVVLGFSIEDGLTLRVNGDQVSRAANDKTPLDNGVFQIGNSGTHGANTFRGKLGHFMGFNADLTSAANRGYLAALESILMGKYGIS